MRNAWINGVLGVWLAIAAFLSTDIPSAKINDIFIGAIVILVARALPTEKAWQRWLMMVVGTWVFVAGFITPLAYGNAYVLNNLISGALIVIADLAIFTQHSGVKAV